MTSFRRKLLMKKKGPSETLVFEQAQLDLTNVHGTSGEYGDRFTFVAGTTYRYVFDFILTDLQYSTTTGRIQSQEGAYTFLNINSSILNQNVHVDTGTGYTCTNGRSRRVINARSNTSTGGVRDYWSGTITNLKIYEVN